MLYAVGCEIGKNGRSKVICCVSLQNPDRSREWVASYAAPIVVLTLVNGMEGTRPRDIQHTIQSSIFLFQYSFKALCYAD